MDRLVCGDVGFGKTEVAIRAAFGAGFIVRRIGIYTARLLFACFVLLTTVYFLTTSRISFCSAESW